MYFCARFCKNMEKEDKLIRTISRRFNKGVVEYGLIDEGDKILVGLSGGKDSLALLELLAKRSRIYKPRFSVVAAHVVMTNIAYDATKSLWGIIRMTSWKLFL